MLDKKLRRTGILLMDRNRIFVDGFAADGCMCREVAALALLWAIGELQRELTALIRQPGGTGKSCIGLPCEVSMPPKRPNAGVKRRPREAGTSA